jgi:hypothetical protein
MNPTKDSTITEKVLTKNRSVLIWTSSRNNGSGSALKFQHHGASIFIPLRTVELAKFRDLLTEHLLKT